MRKRCMVTLAVIAALTTGLAGCGQGSSINVNKSVNSNNNNNNKNENNSNGTTAQSTEYHGSNSANLTYDDIIAEYSSVIQALNDGVSLDDLYEKYPDVAFDSFADYIDSDEEFEKKFYYAKTDINGDGSDELVLGLHYPEAESDEDVSIIGFFAQDKEGVAHFLLGEANTDPQSAFAFEILVYIYPDNRFVLDEEPYDNGLYIFNIADDGYSAQLEAHYDIEYNESSEEDGDYSVNYVDADGNVITGDEMSEMLGASEVELSWCAIE